MLLLLFHVFLENYCYICNSTDLLTHLCRKGKVDSTEFSKMHNMPDLRNSYLQYDNAECLPCVLHAMPDYFNLMNATLRTCINSRNACIRITIG